MTLALRLRAERKRLGMPQTALAVAGGVQKGAQVNYEGGRRWPDARYLELIAQHGVDILYVLTGERASLQPSADPRPLGDRLRMLRKRRGLSQRAMADALQISTSGYQYYERGERDLPAAVAERICAEFGIDMDWLWGDGVPQRPRAPIQAITPAQRAALDAAHDALRRLQLDLETLGRDSPKNALLERALEDSRRHLHELDGLRAALQAAGAPLSPQPASAGAPSPAPGGAGAF